MLYKLRFDNMHRYRKHGKCHITLMCTINCHLLSIAQWLEINREIGLDHYAVVVLLTTIDLGSSLNTYLK